MEQEKYQTPKGNKLRGNLLDKVGKSLTTLGLVGLIAGVSIPYAWAAYNNSSEQRKESAEIRLSELKENYPILEAITPNRETDNFDLSFFMMIGTSATSMLSLYSGLSLLTRKDRKYKSDKK